MAVRIVVTDYHPKVLMKNLFSLKHQSIHARGWNWKKGLLSSQCGPWTLFAQSEKASAG